MEAKFACNDHALTLASHSHHNEQFAKYFDNGKNTTIGDIIHV